MKIFVIEKNKLGERSKELASYESDFVPSVGDIIGATAFPDVEQRVVVQRLIIPTLAEQVILYCDPPAFPVKR